MNLNFDAERPVSTSAATHTRQTADSAISDALGFGLFPVDANGPFFGPAGLPSDHALAALQAAHGQDRSIVVAIEGSSSCPEIATGVRLAGPQQLVVTSTQLPADNGPGACSQDLTPHLSTLQLPAGVDENKLLHITVDHHTIALPPR